MSQPNGNAQAEAGARPSANATDCGGRPSVPSKPSGVAAPRPQRIGIPCPQRGAAVLERASVTQRDSLMRVCVRTRVAYRPFTRTRRCLAQSHHGPFASRFRGGVPEIRAKRQGRLRSGQRRSGVTSMVNHKGNCFGGCLSISTPRCATWTIGRFGAQEGGADHISPVFGSKTATGVNRGWAKSSRGPGLMSTAMACNRSEADDDVVRCRRSRVSKQLLIDDESPYSSRK